MTPDERNAFLAAPHTAVLSTLTAEGRIHAVPVWFRWDGGAFRIITGADSVKVRNLRANLRASLCIDERDTPEMRSLTAEGPVTFDAVTREERVALWTLYRGPEVAERVTASGAHEGMVLLLLTPERWIG
jgi:PPOX class probable F420-dependent enzyme